MTKVTFNNSSVGWYGCLFFLSFQGQHCLYMNNRKIRPGVKQTSPHINRKKASWFFLAANILLLLWRPFLLWWPLAHTNAVRTLLDLDNFRGMKVLMMLASREWTIVDRMDRILSVYIYHKYSSRSVNSTSTYIPFKIHLFNRSVCVILCPLKRALLCGFCNVCAFFTVQLEPMCVVNIGIFPVVSFPQ